MEEPKPVRTVADLIAALQRLDPALPVGCLTYHPERSVAGAVGVDVVKYRRAHPGDNAFGDTPHWFELGSKPALYHEERGGALEEVAVLYPGK